MWKLIVFVGFLYVVYATPVSNNEITKKDVDLVSEEISAIVDLAGKEWISEATEINQRVNSTYIRDIRNSYEKLQSDIDSAIRNSTEYIVSRIIPFLNQCEKNRDLLSCIDLTKTLSAIDEVVEKALSNVQTCKWKAIYPIFYDVASVQILPLVGNGNITNLDDEKLQCSQDTSSTNYTEILRCINKVKEHALQTKEEIKLYLKNEEASLIETLRTGVRVVNECKSHINFAEVRPVQDEQFDRIQKCITDRQNESTDNKTGNKNEIAAADMRDVVNSIVLHIGERVNRKVQLANSTDKEAQQRLSSALKNTSTPERLRIMQFIEKSWQANGHENQTLSTYLPADEYSHLMKCTEGGAICTAGILIMTLGLVDKIGRQRLALDGSIDVQQYFTDINEQGKKCMGNLNNVQNFHDAIQCILRVEGQASSVFTNGINGGNFLVEVLVEKIQNLLGNPANCPPPSPSSKDMQSVKRCFSRMYAKKAKVIFK